MPIGNRLKRGKGRPGRPVQPRQCGTQSSSLIQLLVVYVVLLFLDLVLKFRLEYLYPITLLVQEVHNLWKCSSLSSIFFLAVTFSTDLTLYMMTQKHTELLFMCAGFLVWLQVVYTGENRFTATTFVMACLILCVEAFINYKHIRSDELFYSDNLRPIASHCIGYPLVSLGYCIKRYLAYLMRIRKQSEVETKNKFYYNLLHEALPPENYMYIQLDPKDDDASSENTESDTVGEESSAEKSEHSWFQKMKELLSDMACFTRPVTPLIQVKTPMSNHNTSISPTSTLKPTSPSTWSILLRHLSSVNILSKKKSIQSSTNNSGTIHNKQSDIHQKPGTPPAKNTNTNSETKTNNSAQSITTKRKSERAKSSCDNRESPKGPPSPKDTNAPNEMKKRKNTQDENTLKEILPKPKQSIIEETDSFSERLLQIKTQDDFKKDEKREENDKEELRRLQKEIKKRNKIEADLNKKIQDLIQHEDFTKEELENLQKREHNAKTLLTQEKTRRQELEILLRKEEELRKQNEKSLADERRKNMNTTEIDNAKLRIRQLELERDAGREELRKEREDKKIIVEDRKNLHDQNNELRNGLHCEKEERRKTQQKLEQEARVKMMLLQQLQVLNAERDNRSRGNHSPSLFETNPPQVPSSPNSYNPYQQTN